MSIGELSSQSVMIDSGRKHFVWTYLSAGFFNIQAIYLFIKFATHLAIRFTVLGSPFHLVQEMMKIIIRLAFVYSYWEKLGGNGRYCTSCSQAACDKMN